MEEGVLRVEVLADAVAHGGILDGLSFLEVALLLLLIPVDESAHSGEHPRTLLRGLEGDGQRGQIALGLGTKRVEGGKALAIHQVGIATGYVRRDDSETMVLGEVDDGVVVRLIVRPQACLVAVALGADGLGEVLIEDQLDIRLEHLKPEGEVLPLTLLQGLEDTELHPVADGVVVQLPEEDDIGTSGACDELVEGDGTPDGVHETVGDGLSSLLG